MSSTNFIESVCLKKSQRLPDEKHFDDTVVKINVKNLHVTFILASTTETAKMAATTTTMAAAMAIMTATSTTTTTENIAIDA